MNDISEKSSSSNLAIVEKKPQRPGGCVGIFFQLFDWNKRLAKKKLFSKKLLPPARAKRASKKFGGDDKLPTAKLLLIAEENRGGFPNVKKSGPDNVGNLANGTHEMRSPSLVARLMGLESIPAARREKPKKAFLSESNQTHGKNPGADNKGRCSESFVCDQDGFHMGKGHTKLESRPQKLQKTGVFEMSSVTRFGADALQFKSVLSRSRKHQPKLASPVKSPRVGKNASRLMGAATKILEPGLQASNKAKCALTYSPSFHFTSRDEDMTQGPPFLTTDETQQSSYCTSSSKTLKGQPSCKSCGNWIDVLDSRSNGEEQLMGIPSSGLGLGNAPPLGPGRSRVKLPESSLLQERDEVGFQYRQEQPSPGVEVKGNRHSRIKTSTLNNNTFREYQEHYRSSTRRIRYLDDVAPATARNNRTKRQSQMLSSKDRGNLRPKFNNMNNQRDPFTASAVDRNKDFVAVSQSSASCTKASMPSKVCKSSKIDSDRIAVDRMDDSSSRLRGSIHKKRPINGTGQIENASFDRSTFRKQRDVRNATGRHLGANSCSKNQNRLKSEVLTDAKENAADSRKEAGAISFTFSSPMRNSTESLSPTLTLGKTSGHGEFMSSNSSPKTNLTLDANMRRPSSHVATHLRGDALGALLEEKLKELTCRDRDELETMDGVPGRSTAAILEELIFALTAEKPVSLEDGDNCSIGLSQDDSLSYGSEDPLNDTASHCQRLIVNQKIQAGLKSRADFGVFPLVGDSEHHSPGSILDASFSNESCFSESLDCYTGNKLHSESMESSYNQPLPSDYDAELSDCATSISIARTRIDSDSLKTDHIDVGFVGNELIYASETERIANANLLLGSLCDVPSVGDIPIGPLLDKLEALSDASWTTSDCRMGLMGSKNRNQTRKFLLDCFIEFLDSNYGCYTKSRIKALISPQNNVELFKAEVHEEIQWWANLAGKSFEETMEMEMNHSLGRWMDFEVESFEVGETIESDIVQLLVNELVVDLKQCRTCT
ncbi:Dnaa initiator-associating protein [Thalictrum thalictroides]|uniref:Dnaa initiator-associating protein n=1 Tax=Thalictrum thalictroides TaxID=46969 RepID=A0A7J6X458_THATH|nr:Dnaa initiator-associating protein [Thalictrum thalictroides]